jgi:superoxide reductase
MGQVQHPMLPEHYITDIDFYVDNEFISRVKLTPGKLNPAAALHMKAGGGKLTVIEHCNLHGAWISQADL